MKDKRTPFSKRYGHTSQKPEITIREDAPEEFRAALLDTAREVALRPSQIREIVCRVLRKRANPSNWTEDTNVWDEVQELLHECEWFRVYDITEAIQTSLDSDSRGSRRLSKDKAGEFRSSINDCLRELGIGWQLVGDTLQSRGPEAFESAVRSATETLEATERPTASREIHEAMKALSRRPEADLTGALYHSMATLECVARDIAGDPKATLGEILKHHPHVLPKPLDQAASKLWGYASDQARQLLEQDVEVERARRAGGGRKPVEKKRPRSSRTSKS